MFNTKKIIFENYRVKNLCVKTSTLIAKPGAKVMDLFLRSLGKG